MLTVSRLILAIGCFVFLSLEMYLQGMILFVIAAGTDWLDGYWARRFNQITQLGRILDPFADKFIICGTFVFLVAEPTSGITAWMAVVVLAREMLVTAIRGFLEQRGADFSAQMAGKLKMVFQCGAVILSLWGLHVSTGQESNLTLIRDICVWLAIGTTVYSGVGYLFRATRLMRD